MPNSNYLQQLHKSCNKVNVAPGTSPINKINFLKQYIRVPEKIISGLHVIRKVGNAASHQGYSSYEDTIRVSSIAQYIYTWYVEAYVEI